MENIKKWKPVRFLFFLGIAFFSVLVPLGMIELVPSEWVVISGQAYLYLMMAGLALELVLRRL